MNWWHALMGWARWKGGARVSATTALARIEACARCQHRIVGRVSDAKALRLAVVAFGKGAAPRAWACQKCDCLLAVEARPGEWVPAGKPEVRGEACPDDPPRW